MTWLLEADNGETRTFDTRSEAERAKADLEALDMSIELSNEPVADGGTQTQAAVVASDDATDRESPADRNDQDADGDDHDGHDLPARDVTEDPLTWMPSHFVDDIEGVPAINRKGYAVLAEHYGISVTAEPLSIPSESDWEYAEFRAVATTPDGREYSGFGSAHVERGDDKTLLGELAETRAVKRATAAATGVGMVAVSEMRSATAGDGQ